MNELDILKIKVEHLEEVVANMASRIASTINVDLNEAIKLLDYFSAPEMGLYKRSLLSGVISQNNNFYKNGLLRKIRDYNVKTISDYLESFGDVSQVIILTVSSPRNTVSIKHDGSLSMTIGIYTGDTTHYIDRRSIDSLLRGECYNDYISLDLYEDLKVRYPNLRRFYHNKVKHVDIYNISAKLVEIASTLGVTLDEVASNHEKFFSFLDYGLYDVKFTVRDDAISYMEGFLLDEEGSFKLSRNSSTMRSELSGVIKWNVMSAVDSILEGVKKSKED